MAKDSVAEHPQIARKPQTSDQRGEPSLTESGMYAQMVTQLRQQALTSQELADVIGVNSRQVMNWVSGQNVPSGARRDKLLEVDYIVRQLREVYTREGAEIWLHGRKKSLGHQRPIDLMREGKFQTVLAAIERLTSGAM